LTGSSVFLVSGVKFTLRNLTIANGLRDGSLNKFWTVTLTNSAFTGNRAGGQSAITVGEDYGS
jgi:hypothetical protein